MTKDEFRAAGERLFGKRWQTAMAKMCGVNPRTVRRWASGDTQVPKLVAMTVDTLDAKKEQA